MPIKKIPTFTTIRVTTDTAKRLEQIAARLTIKDGNKRFADDAAEYAVEAAEKELEKNMVKA